MSNYKYTETVGAVTVTLETDDSDYMDKYINDGFDSFTDASAEFNSLVDNMEDAVLHMSDSGEVTLNVGSYVLKGKRKNPFK